MRVCMPLTAFYWQYYPARARTAGPKGLRAEALGLLLADGALTVTEWENYLACQPSFFYENNCNSGTENQKIVPKVGNERSLRELQTDRCLFWVKMHFWPKIHFWAECKNGPFSLIPVHPGSLSYWVIFLWPGRSHQVSLKSGQN